VGNSTSNRLDVGLGRNLDNLLGNVVVVVVTVVVVVDQSGVVVVVVVLVLIVVVVGASLLFIGLNTSRTTLTVAAKEMEK
jgi:hypothetical protein